MQVKSRHQPTTVSRLTKLQIMPPTERHLLCLLLTQRKTSEGTDFKVGRTEANTIKIQVAKTTSKGRGSFYLAQFDLRIRPHDRESDNSEAKQPEAPSTSRQVDKDIGVFCHYHEYNDHDIESCIALRKVVERLINEGKLDQYLSTKSTPKQPANRQINMISGGAPIADTSNCSIKRYMRAVQHSQILNIVGALNDKIR
ncbi:unnamed protein product [Prunus armeniaca]